MKAILTDAVSGPAEVRFTTMPDPIAGAGDVLIDVHASGVTFPDLLSTRGLYQRSPEPPFSLGLEIAGVVETAPEGSFLRPGQRVAAVTDAGGYASKAVVAPHRVFVLPDHVSFEQGAALPVNFLTAQYALQLRGNVGANDVVLVHGAGGGLGSVCVQVAKSLGAFVIGVVSDERKAELARTCGADLLVHSDRFRAEVDKALGPRAVVVAIDVVGGDRMTDTLRCLAPEGRVLVLGFAAGDIPVVKVNRLLLGNIEVRGVAWAERAVDDPGFLIRQWRQVDEILNTVSPIVSESFPLEHAAVALEKMDTRAVVGKIVLTH